MQGALTETRGAPRISLMKGTTVTSRPGFQSGGSVVPASKGTWMKLREAGKTHVGMKRSHNEDSFLLVPSHQLYVVADGMGGHACGEVASGMSVETIQEFFSRTAEDDDATWPCRAERNLNMTANRLKAAIELANHYIFEQAQSDSRFRGMGTTVVGVAFDGQHVNVAHVGDSRVYRLRNGVLTMLTEDHSLLNDYKKMASLTEEEEKNFPHKNIIVRALGMKDRVLVDVTTERPEPGDIYLLCSDGLTGEVDDAELRDIIEDHGTDLDGACDAMIESACQHGGKDNITTVLIRVEDT